MFLASHAQVTSKRYVHFAPGRAQGTCATSTPWSGHCTRGAADSRNVRVVPVSTVRHRLVPTPASYPGHDRRHCAHLPPDRASGRTDTTRTSPSPSRSGCMATSPMTMPWTPINCPNTLVLRMPCLLRRSGPLARPKLRAGAACRLKPPDQAPTTTSQVPRGSVSSGGNREGLSTVAGLAFGPAHSSAEASVIEGERRGRTIRGQFVRATSKSGRDRVSEPKSQEKPFSISKHLVWEAYRRVKANKGAPGVDGCSIEDFEADLKNNLYRIWNRMSSGSYFPPPVKAVEIPKPHGGVRVLGVPTVADRIAQTVVAMEFEKRVEPMFHPDSYGYRPGRSALDAVGTCRRRCWENDWVLDLDIQKFFDSVDHNLMVKAVEANTDQPWVVLYVKRWLVAPLQHPDGSLHERDQPSLHIQHHPRLVGIG